MSAQDKSGELEHARRILHHPEFFWNEATQAGRKGSVRRAEWIMARTGMKDGMRVLEVGCGTGFFSEIFARTGARISAVDLSADLLEKAFERRLKNVHFRLADVEEMPYEDAAFDAAVGIRVLHHLDIGRAFPEITRVLKPGARIAFCEPNMMNPQILVQKNIPVVKRWMGDTPGETAFFRWGMSRFLRRARYTEIEVEPFDFLHPWTPDFLLPFGEAIGPMLEKIPLIREIAGSLRISARRS